MHGTGQHYGLKLWKDLMDWTQLRLAELGGQLDVARVSIQAPASLYASQQKGLPGLMTSVGDAELTFF